MGTLCDQSIDDEPRQVPTHGAAVAVLQPEHDAAGSTGERDRGDDTVGLLTRRGADQSESTGRTDGRPRLVASGTSRLEDHRNHLTQGVLQSSSAPSELGERTLKCAPCMLATRTGVAVSASTAVPYCTDTIAFDLGVGLYPALVSETSRAVLIPRDRAVERVTRCMFGLILFGTGISLLIESDLGAAPWDVFHTGISELTGISTGWIIVITGVLLLLLWIPLRERPGLGTILNATVIGIVVDIALPIIDESDVLVVRLAMMIGGVVVVAIGSGFYIGAGLGPGPRDGLMTGLAKQTVAGRSISVRTARTFVEVVVLVIGVALGGAIGIGTAVFTFGIGPLVQIFLPRLTMAAATPTPRVFGAAR